MDLNRLEAWWKDPNGSVIAAKWCGGLILLRAVVQAFRDGSVGAFFAELAAMVLYLTLTFGPLVLALWLGHRVSKRTRSAALAVVAGIGIAVGGFWLAVQIEEASGLEGRMERLRHLGAED